MGETYAKSESARRAAVSKAWANEYALVKEGKGTRDWTPSQQAEILATGKCKGYQGHHKFSVKQNPELAGNEKNIQFLTKSEHLKAHNNNFKTDPRGRYNTEKGKLEKYTDGRLKAEPTNELSKKMAESRKASSVRKYETMKAEKRNEAKCKAAERAKNYDRRSVKKQTSEKLGKDSGHSKDAKKTEARKTSQALRSSRTKSASKTSSLKSTKTSQALAKSRAASSTSNMGKGNSGHGGHGASGMTGGGKGTGGNGGASGGHGGHGK